METPLRQPMQAIDSSSKIEPLNYEFPASIIDKAQGGDTGRPAGQPRYPVLDHQRS